MYQFMSNDLVELMEAEMAELEKFDYECRITAGWVPCKECGELLIPGDFCQEHWRNDD